MGASDRPSRWKRLLCHRFSQAGIIPPETKVDPSAFSEDEFPVVCPKCEYLLRGLPDGRCPECGRPFERGRLLVEQYVIEQGRRCCKWTHRLAKNSLLVGIVLIVGGSLVFEFVSPRLGTRSPFTIWCFVGLVSGYCLFFASGILYWRISRQARNKPRQVMEAIDRHDPLFRAAQRYAWVPPTIGLLGMVVLLVFLDGSGDRSLDHYRRHPSHVLIVLGIACVIGGAIYVVARIRQRRRGRAHEIKRQGTEG